MIQVYAPTINADKTEKEDFYANLQQLLGATPKKDSIFIIGDRNVKVGSKVTDGITGDFGLDTRSEADDKLVKFCQNNLMFIANIFQ